MIPKITEVNLPAYATLQQATVTLQEMGDRTIETQMKIDGSITPNFVGTDGKDWALSFGGEKYILPLREPQASKDNTSLCSVIDLTFYHWAIYQLKRYYFIELASTQSGTAIADKYEASLGLTLPNFVTAFNAILAYYFTVNGTQKIVATYNPSGSYSLDPAYISINYSYIWDVLQQVNEIYDTRWDIVYNANNDIYTIRFGYSAPEISHIFQYGFDGGLLKFERQVQSPTIKNIILGRGGTNNVPKLYFKDYTKYIPVGKYRGLVATVAGLSSITSPVANDYALVGDSNSFTRYYYSDSSWIIDNRLIWQNGLFAPDPDAIPELVNISFDGLRDYNFRQYVRGWAAHKGYVGHEYVSGQGWAYEKGYSDTLFNPVEYVKDDTSIAKYGELWGGIDAMDDIYPSIQDVTVVGQGRIDSIVDISEIVSDDIAQAAASEVVITNIDGTTSESSVINPMSSHSFRILGGTFTIPENMVGNVTCQWTFEAGLKYSNGDMFGWQSTRRRDSSWRQLIYVKEENSYIKVINADGDEIAPSGLTEGTYTLVYYVTVKNDNTGRIEEKDIAVTAGASDVKCTTTIEDLATWRPTFDIWVKNIWGTTKGEDESNIEYADRVWAPILGDSLGNSAAVTFSTGMLSMSSDWQFVVIGYEYDNSKSISVTESGVTHSVSSEWKLTLQKSDAEYDATGYFIPNSKTGGNATAGDHFFFTGIDMPNQYVVWAEQKLTAVKQTEGISVYSDVTPTWIISLDKVKTNLETDGQTIADSLSIGSIVNINDSRFTGGVTLQLYLQSIIYRWMTDGVMFPDIEISLSDKVISTKTKVEQIESDVSAIKKQYVTMDSLEQAVDKIVGDKYLMKVGASQVSYAATEFASTLNGSDFEQNEVAGKGWGFYQDGYGISVLEVDKLIARQELKVNSIVSNYTEYAGGKQISSAASIECTQVDDLTTGYVCHFNQRFGSVSNLFVVGDIAMAQRFNPLLSQTKFYRRLVTAVSDSTITLSKTDYAGEGVPEVGDLIVQYGHISDVTRQFVIVRDVIGGGYESMLSGLNSVGSIGNEYYFAGRKSGNSPSWFVGDADGDHASYSYDSNLNRYIFSIHGDVYVGDDDTNISYLVGALNKDGSSGLLLANQIAVYNGNAIMGGINGIYDGTKLGGGIAAWYGGPKVDKIVDTSAVSYATSLFRFDGTGYLAGGNIRWDSTGAVTLAGANISIGGDATLTQLFAWITEIRSWFGEDANHNIYVKKRTVGSTEVERNFYSYGCISAGGYGASSPATLTSLYLLADVQRAGSHDAVQRYGQAVPTDAIDGDVLVFHGGHWYAAPQSGITPTLASLTLQKNGITIGTYNPSSATTLNVTITESDVKSALGASYGVALLDSTGKIYETYLPSYVDDVVTIEDMVATLPSVSVSDAGKKYIKTSDKKIYTVLSTGVFDSGVSPEDGKIYITKDDNKTYRWSGSNYVSVGGDVVLGTTHSTAFYGDWGNTAYIHSQVTDGTNPHATTFANLINKPTTIAGYGITDAKIANGVITLGGNSITPLTSHQIVSLASGTSNGTLKLTVGSSVTDNIAVKGLGSLAYKSSLVASDIPDLGATYVKFGDRIVSNNRVSSSRKYFLHPKLNNRLYAANERFVVTNKWYNADGTEGGNMTVNPFDGVYEGAQDFLTSPDMYCELYIGKQAEGSLPSTTGAMWTYNGGYLRLSFYTISGLPSQAPTVSIYKRASWNTTGGEWVSCAVSKVDSVAIYEAVIPVVNYVAAIKIRYYGNNNDGVTGYRASLIECEYLYSGSASEEEVTVTKYAKVQDLYGEVVAPKFTVRGGTSSQFLKANGTVDSTSYLPASGGTISGGLSLRCVDSTSLMLQLLTNSSSGSYARFQYGYGGANGGTAEFGCYSGVGAYMQAYSLSGMPTICLNESSLNGAKYRYSGTYYNIYHSGNFTSTNISNWGFVNASGAVSACAGTYLKLIGGTISGSILAESTSVNLGSTSKPWGWIFANRWYPNANNTSVYIEFDSTNNTFKIVGNVFATGQISCGV